VRIVRRVAERTVDLRLQLFGDHVLEPLRLVVDVVHVQAERLCEIELQQAVMADDFDRDLLARARERDASIRLVHGEVERRQFLDHRARGSRRHALLFRECGHGDAAAVRAKLVDLPQVVLDRLGEGRLRHHHSLGSA